MFSLIKYHNDTYSVVPSNKVEKRDGSNCVVKSNGGKYSAFFISKNDNKSVLLGLKEKREENGMYQSLPTKLPSPKKSIVIWIDRTPTPLRELENVSYETISPRTSLGNYDSIFLTPSSSNIDKHNSTEQSSIEMQSSIQMKKENDLVLPTPLRELENISNETISPRTSLGNYDSIFLAPLSSNIDKHNSNEQSSIEMQSSIQIKKENDLVLPCSSIYISSAKSSIHLFPQKKFITDIGSKNLDKLLSPQKSVVISIDNTSPMPPRELENFDKSHKSGNTIPNNSSLSNETTSPRTSLGNYDSAFLTTSKHSNIDKHNSTEQMQKENNDLVLQCSSIHVSNKERSTNICSPQKENITDTSSINSDSLASEYLPKSTTENNEISNEQNGSTTTSKSINVIRNTLNISSVIVPHRSNKYKKHFCIFCKTLQCKLARHFFLIHKSEKEIKSALCYPKKSKERLSIIEELRKKGDFMHNTSEEHNSGILIVSRQQQTKSKNVVNDYACCKNCNGFFSKKSLRLHLRKCGKNNPNNRENIIVGRRLTQYVHSAANDDVKTRIFPVLNHDKVTNSIQYDELIIKYANTLSEKYTSVHHHDMIRAQLRLLGRFKIEAMKQNSEIKQFKDIFKPQLFDSCTEAFRIVANWDTNLMWFKTPAVAHSLATLIKKCGYMQRTELIKCQEMDSKKDVEDFLLLWEEKIPSLINKKALEDQINQKRSKNIVLPSKADIKTLFEFLKTRCLNNIQNLSNKFCAIAWADLVQTTLVSVQIFNRRRAGEIERLTVSNYNNKEIVTDSIKKDILKSASSETIALAKQFVRISLRGKLGRTVGVLLCPLCIEAIEIILKYRSQAGITNENEFIFACPGASKLSKQYYRACPLLRKFSDECGAKFPESLRGTTLRKHVATHTALLNIEEASVEKLHNFIHKRIRRVPLAVQEITCVSKILMASIADEEEEDEEEDDELEDMHEFNNNVGDEQNVDENTGDISNNDIENSGEESLNKSSRKRRINKHNTTEQMQKENNDLVLPCSSIHVTNKKRSTHICSPQKEVITAISSMNLDSLPSEYLPKSTTANNEISNDQNGSTTTSKSINVIRNTLNISSVIVPHRSNKYKKHFCIFCKTLQCKLARHFFLIHKSEKEIKSALCYPKKSKERLSIIEVLRKKGDFMHNTSEEHNSGILIVSRQQQTKSKNVVNDYACCKNCNGFFSKKSLRLHLRKCGKNNPNNRENIIVGRRLTQYIHSAANDDVKTRIFPVLNHDKVTNSIQYDELIIKYANTLSEKYTSVHHHDMIRAQLRLLGRFKIEAMKQNSEIKQFKDIFKPQLFDSCIEALRIVANWDTNLMWFKTPAVAQSLATLIKKCGYMQRTELIKCQEMDSKKHLEDFLLLWEEKIPSLINKKALEDQIHQKRSKNIVLPSKADIKTLFEFLKTRCLNNIQNLSNKFCAIAWPDLVQTTLVLVHIFNRRRAGEIERLTVSNYNNKEIVTDSIKKDILKSASSETIALAKQFVRISLRGKLGRTVSVLLCPLCIEAIEIILKYRSQAGITNENELIFACTGTSKLSKQYYRVCPLLRKFSDECGAKFPESLRGTSLRKHIATHTALLNIEEASVEKLTYFIHKRIRRVPLAVQEITCVSKILMASIGDEEEDEEEDDELEDMNEFNNNVADEQNVDENAGDFSNNDIENSGEESLNKSSRKRRITSPFGKIKRVRWSEEERNAVRIVFGDLKELDGLPTLPECLKAIRRFPELKNRTPEQLKTFIDNQRRYK